MNSTNDIAPNLSNFSFSEFSSATISDVNLILFLGDTGGLLFVDCLVLGDAGGILLVCLFLGEIGGITTGGGGVVVSLEDDDDELRLLEESEAFSVFSSRKSEFIE